MKNISELQKIPEKFVGIDGRIRNTTKVVLLPEKTFRLIKEKDKAPRNMNLIPKKVGKIPGKRGIVLTCLKTFSKPLEFDNKISYLTFVFASFPILFKPLITKVSMQRHVCANMLLPLYWILNLLLPMLLRAQNN